MNAGKLNGSVFIDLKKAFDTVDHNILLRKLSVAMVSMAMLFSCLNHIWLIEHGDAILGPLLFIIYINDSPKCLQHTTPGKFADDTYIATAHADMSTIKCSSNSDLTAVHNGLKTKKLSCNTSKTSYMAIGSRQNLAKAKFMNLEMDNIPIEHKPSTKLLGVHIDEMLPWDNQIKHISS